jgi:hypothetical protein
MLRTGHSDPSVRKLKNMLAEKELEISMLQEAYKQEEKVILKNEPRSKRIEHSVKDWRE